MKSKTKLLTQTEALHIIDNLKNKPANVNFNELKMYCDSPFSYETTVMIKNKLKEMKLFDFEIVQLLDNKPKSILCLQTCLEEMEERFSENDLDLILSLFMI